MYINRKTTAVKHLKSWILKKISSIQLENTSSTEWQKKGSSLKGSTRHTLKKKHNSQTQINDDN